ncbi:MAG: hypothetical protein HKN02_00460, partial [Rhodobacteraceae bacterium]|nr:hypothetical protein [Paracoccaceae bacterium]
MAIFLAVLLIVLMAPFVLAQKLFVMVYEGDALHTIEIVLRLVEGERQHIDFQTPIGILSFLPAVFFMQLGLPFGAAFIYGHLMIALLALPAIWWVAISRFGRFSGYWFAAATLVILTSWSAGIDQASVTLALHYNRWAWGLSFIAIAVAVMPPRIEGTARIDGLILGVMMASLALIKMTYFVAFAPIVFLALLAQGQLRILGSAIIVGFVIAAVATLLGGLEFWRGYYADLQWVRQSEVRNAPGFPIPELIVGAQYLGGTLLALAGGLFVRQSGRFVQGYSLILLIPAFIFVTYQNFGNAPIWVLLLPALYFGLRPDEEKRNGAGWDLRDAIGFAGAAAVALSIPYLTNIVMTGLRHVGATGETVSIDFGANPALRDVRVSEIRTFEINAADYLVAPGALFERVSEFMTPEQSERVLREPDVFLGQSLPRCALANGVVGATAVLAKELETLSAPVFVADIVAQHWIFADVPRLQGSAPWNYGSLSG